MFKVNIDSSAIQYMEGSVLYKETDVSKLKDIVFSNDNIHDHTIIPCRISIINHAVSGIATPSGIPVFKYEDKFFVQGEIYNLSVRELASIIYHCSVACNLDLSDRESEGSSLVFTQNISAGVNRGKVRVSQHSSVSEYPVDRNSVFSSVEEKYRYFKHQLNGRGIVQCPIGIIPAIEHEYFNFLRGEGFTKR